MTMPFVCDCDCHTTGAMCFAFCCQGQCEGCQSHIVAVHLDDHRRQCCAWQQWAATQKRKELRTRGLLRQWLAAQEVAP